MTPMPYDFLVDAYATERIKVVSVWSEFRDDDLPVRPHPSDPRGRSVHEQMVHQCVSGGEADGGAKAPLPGPGDQAATERANG